MVRSPPATSRSAKLLTLLLSRLRSGEDGDPLLMMLDSPNAQVAGSSDVLLEGVRKPPLSSGGRAGSQVGGSRLRVAGESPRFAPARCPASSPTPSRPRGTQKHRAALFPPAPHRSGLRGEGEDVTSSHRTRGPKSPGSPSPRPSEAQPF